MTNKGAKTLSQILLKNPRIKWLDLSSISVTVLVSFNSLLAGNHIADDGAIDIAAAIEKGSALETLIISNMCSTENNIRERGAKAIAAAIRSNPRLTGLHMVCKFLFVERYSRINCG